MPATVTVRPVRPEDRADWERLRYALWPAHPGDHAGEIAEFFAGDGDEPIEVLLACLPDGRAVGFAELNIRPYAEDCYSGRVAYLEGWYVDEPFRRRGIGAALVKAAEDWGRAQGCTEFASDALLDNTVSHAAHRALGFEETVRIVCFRKAL